MILKKMPNALIAFLITGIFSLRWRNALPFSGRMPVLTDGDNIEIWSRFLIYAREPFHFPLGLIKTLSYPFETANIVRGPLELFAIPLKVLSKVLPAAGEFYYFSLAEIVSVFLTAFFAAKIFERFGVRSLWMRILGTTLTALSFPLLFRSSVYHGLSYQVVYFAFYMAFAYVYMCFYRKPGTRKKWWLAALLPLAAMVDYYLVMAMAVIFAVFIFLHGMEAVLSADRAHKSRFRQSLALLVSGVVLTYGVLFLLGNEENMAPSVYFTPLSGRYATGWGYGGGMGGGFHSADLLTFVIPPEDRPDLPNWKKVGPSALLTKAGFGLTTADLKDGQYEGFTYIGTVSLVLILGLFIGRITRWLQNPRWQWRQRVFCCTSRLQFGFDLFPLPLMFGLACFALFTLSWGYILHVGGHRLNNLATPALILAEIWPRFIFARSLGKLATPLLLFILMGTVILLNRYGFPWLYSRKRSVRGVMVAVLIALTGIHIWEIRGYLKPTPAVQGNDIALVFGAEDRQTIKKVLEDKTALFMVPALRSSAGWSKVGYALAYHGHVPLSGATIGIAVPDAYKHHFAHDLNLISTGRISQFIERYGPDVVIAAPREVSLDLRTKADMPLTAVPLRDRNVDLLTVSQANQ